jgi:acyl-coenzyme A thioesterase PaaI-like protein
MTAADTATSAACSLNQSGQRLAARLHAVAQARADRCLPSTGPHLRAAAYFREVGEQIALMEYDAPGLTIRPRFDIDHAKGSARNVRRGMITTAPTGQLRFRPLPDMPHEWRQVDAITIGSLEIVCT